MIENLKNWDKKQICGAKFAFFIINHQKNGSVPLYAFIKKNHY